MTQVTSGRPEGTGRPASGKLEAVHDQRRLALFLLACAGALVAHAVAYLVVAGGFFVGEAHGHVGLMTAAVLPMASLAVVWIALRAARSVDLRHAFGWRRLAIAQSAIFLAQESVEILSLGDSLLTGLTQPAIWLGLLLQPLVAALLVAMLGVAVHIAVALASLPIRPQQGPASIGSVGSPGVTPTGVPLGAPRSRRGPPLLFVNP